mgnify:CR=1 FL=1
MLIRMVLSYELIGICLELVRRQHLVYIIFIMFKLFCILCILPLKQNHFFQINE